MKLRLHAICLLSGLLIFVSPVVMAVDDTRILIDVSGSMKKTDPENLRVPALKLLNQLLPTGSKAGVWYFGRYVDTSVRWGTVNEQWRKTADKGAGALHSNGLFTNIESALERATRGWEKADPNSTRNIILLTDGKVDISKDPDKNKKSHTRILTDGIEKLKKSGARVYSIALSKNTDEVLLKKLALKTGGFFEQVDNAKALKKVFFKMFEKAVNPDSIELDGNQFTVDKSIKEITMLIFKKKGAEPVKLYPPANDVLTAQHPDKAKWISDESYELITIKKPVPGVWTLEAETDENTRLMVVTDLKLKTRGLPSYALPSDDINFIAELYNRSKMIKKNSFLRFVDFSIRYTGPEGDTKTIELMPAPGHKNKGEYPHKVQQPLEEGAHEFVVSAQSRTFNRSQRIHLQVQWPAVVDITPATTIGEFDISLAPRDEMLKPETFKPKVILVAPDKSEQSVELIKSGSQWTGMIQTNQSGMYQALVEYQAQDNEGQDKSFNQGAYSILGVLKETVSTEQLTAVSPSESEVENIESVSSEEVTASIDWLKVGLIVGAINLLLAIIGGVLYFLGRRRKNSDFSLSDEEPVEDHDSELLEQA